MKLKRYLINIVSKYRKFMCGRYGNDEVNFALILLSVIISLISNIDTLWFVYFFSVIPIAVAVWRMLSRNTNARYEEKLKFIGMISSAKTKVSKISNRIRDRKTHKFFTCKKCKATLRLPKGKGKINITCPKCGNKMIKKT